MLSTINFIVIAAVCHARGTLRETSYEKDGETRYGVTLAADQFDRLVAKERA